MAQPRATVAAQTPQPLGYGLLSAASEQLRDDPHARFGVQFEPASGVSGGIVGINLTTAAPAAALVPDDYTGYEYGYPLVETDPFLIYSGVQAKPVGTTVTELADRARTKLALQAGRWIEKGLWDLQLTDAATEALSATPVGPMHALGLLEEWLGEVVGCHGVIHASRLAAATLAENGYVAPAGQKMLTRLGTPVAFGTGYAGTGPAAVAAAAGTTWLYATGPVQINRAGIESQSRLPREGMAFASNTLTVFATEVVSVGFEVAAVAVPVTL